jgi:hypothetical protein
MNRTPLVRNLLIFANKWPSEISCQAQENINYFLPFPGCWKSVKIGWTLKGKGDKGMKGI